MSAQRSELDADEVRWLVEAADDLIHTIRRLAIGPVIERQTPEDRLATIERLCNAWPWPEATP